MIYENKIDPYSSESFKPKRYNQKFASRINQIAYNNVKARKLRERKKPIDNVLERNRKILLKILHKKDSSIKSYDFLLGSGFDFNFFNRSFSKNGTIYQCVYNYAITKIDNNKYKIYLMK